MDTLHTLTEQLIDAGHTQGEIAQVAGVSQPTISRFCTGKTQDLFYSAGKKIEEFARKKLRKRRKD